MSERTTNVDERVVQMTFNNAEFEKGVATTLSTLDKLKQSLNFKAKTTGMEDLGRAVGLVEKNLQPMANDLDHIADRFSALGIIGDQVIRNLTNRVVAFGEKLVKSVTTEPLTSGFSEYETQMKSIQTILANTGMEGKKGVAKVNEALRELNHYADKTIYNFTQMTENIGRFTAAGVKLQPAVDAIKGTANLAALSGSTSEQASRAMYNLSQALSSGTLKLMDWNSVVNAGMGGTKFQDMLIRTAATMDGYGDKIEEWKKKHVDAFGSFRDSLSKGWITSEVLQNALHNFTYDVTEGTKEYEEALKELLDSGYAEEEAKAILKIAKQATEAATKVRTFTQLIDTLKEALGSGWSESWNYVFGDFNEATEFWTGINDLLSGFIEESSKARNAVLEFWHDAKEGGRADFIEALKELVYDIALIVKPIKNAWDSVFGAFDKNKILEWTRSFKKFAESLHPSVEGFYAIQRIATSVFKIIKGGFKIVGQVVSGAFKLARPLLYLADALLVAVGNIVDSITNNGALLSVVSILEKIGNVLKFTVITAINFIGNGIIKISAALKGLKLSIFKKDIQGVKDGVEGAAKGVPLLASALKILGKIVDGAKNGFDAFVRILASAVVAVVDFFAAISKIPVVSYILGGLKTVVKVIATAFVALGLIIRNIFTMIGNIDLTKIQNPFEFIRNVGLIIIGNVIGAFKALIAFLEAKVPIFVTLENMVKSVFTAFKNGIVNIKNFFTTMKANGGNMDGAKEGLKAFVDGLREFISVMTPARLAAIAITGVMLAMSVTFLKVGSAISGAVNNVSDIFKIIKTGIKDYFAKQNSMVIEAAKSILIIAAAISILAGIKETDLWRAVGALAALIAVMGTFVVLAELVKKPLSTGDVTKNIVNLGGIALMMLELAASFTLIIGTLKQLQGVSVEGLEKPLLAVAGIFATMMLIAVTFDRFKIGLSKGIVSILLMTLSIRSLVNSLLQLKDIDANVVTHALLGMVPLFVALGGIAIIASNIGLTTGLGIILTAKAIEAILPQIKSLYEAMKAFDYWDEIAQYVVTYKEGFSLIGGFILFLVAELGIFGKNIAKVGNSIAAMAAGVFIMVLALEKLTQVAREDTIWPAIGIITALSILIGAWLFLAARVPKKSAIVRVGVAIMLMASSLLIIGLAIAQIQGIIGNGDNAFGTAAAVAIVAGLMVLITYIMKVATQAGKVKKTFGVITAIMVGLSVMIMEIIALSFLNPKDLIMPLITVGTLLYLIGNIFKQLSGKHKFNKAAIAAMGAAIAGIVLVGWQLGELAQLNPKRLLAAGAALTFTIGSLSTLFETIFDRNNSMGNTKEAIAKIVAMGVAIGGIWVIGDAIHKLADQNWAGLLAAGVAISMVMGVLAGCMAIVLKMGSNLTSVGGVLGSLLGFVVAIGVIAGSLYALTALNNNASQLLNAALAISVVLGVVGGLVAIFSAFGGAAIAGAVAGAVAIDLFIGVLVLGFGIISGLIEWINSLTGGAMFESMRQMARDIASVYGEFVATFAKISTSTMPEVGENLAKFAENAKGFFDISKNLDTSAIEGLKNLGLALASFSVSQLIDTLTEWINGKNQIKEMKDVLPDLANGLVAYNNVISAVDEKGNKKHDFSDVEASAEALKKLVEVCDEIPNAGGIVGAIFGENDAGDFGDDLERLGSGLVKYMTEINKINNWDNFDPSINALKKLNSAAEAIPNMGGFVAKVVGDNKAGDFGAQLEKLGSGIASYAKEVSKIKDWSVVDRSSEALVKLDEAAKQVPNFGGWLAGIVGDNKLDEFGLQLEGFAKCIVDYSHDLSGIDTPAMNRTSKALKAFLDSTAGFLELNMLNVGTQIGEVADAVIVMADTLANAFTDYDNEIVKALIDLIEEAIDQAETEKTGDFRDLGVNFIDSMGDGIKAKYKYLGEQIKTLIKNSMDYVRDELNGVSNETGAEIGQEFINGIIGPKGIDPDEHVSPDDYSHKLVDNAEPLINNGFEEIGKSAMKTVDDIGAMAGDFAANTFGDNFSVDNLVDKAKGGFDAIKNIANGDFSIMDYLGGGEAGSDVWTSLDNNPLFKQFSDIFEGTDEESGGFGKAMDDIADELTKATKASKSTSSALKSAKDQLKEYNKYLKYSAKVEEEFAKTTGAAMSVFNKDAPINNAKVAVAALAEQIYADSKKIQDSVDDTATTAEDRAVEVMKAFNEDYESIKKSVSDSVDLFKNFYAEAVNVTKPSDILRNAQSQIDGYSQLMIKYQLLAAKGLPSDYIQELAEKGTEARSEIESILRMTDDERTKYISIWEESRDMKDMVATQIMSARATTNAIKQLKEEAKGYKAVDKNLKSLYTTFKKATSDILNNGGDPIQNSEVIEMYNEINRLCTEANTNITELGKTLEDSTASNAAAALEMIETYTKANEVIDKYNTTFAETEQSVRDLIDNQLSGFETFTKKTGISADDMIDILTSQARGVNQWGKELSSLASRGLSDAILNDLKNLGPEGYEKVHAFYKMTSDQIQQANELYGQKTAGRDRIANMVATSFSTAAVGGVEAYKEQLEIAANNETEFKEVISKFSTSVTSEITNQTSAQIIAGGKDIGKYLTDSIAEGVNNNKSTSTAAAKEAAKEATDGAADTLKEEGEKTLEPAAEDVVKDTAEDVAKTIESEGENIINPAIDNVLDNAKSKVDEFKKEIEKEVEPIKLMTPIKSSLNDDTKYVAKTKNPKDSLYKTDESTTFVETGIPVTWLNKESSKVDPLKSLDPKQAKEKTKLYFDGVTDQVNDSTLMIEKSFGNAADVATDTMTDKEHWDENSPSKTAKSIAEYFMEGLIEGILSVRDRLLGEVDEVADSMSSKIGNVDINLRPIVHNEDGSYSTTETTFQEKWYGDEETGHYRIGHFATIRQDGTRLTDEELNEYIDKVLGSDDPFGVDAQMDNLLYMVADKISTGEYITDSNIEQAFQEASDWDKNMHELQDSMYRDKAMNLQPEGEIAGNSFITGVQQSLIDGITSMILKLKDTITGSSEDTAITLVDMLRSAVEQAGLMGEEESIRPVISPVINWNDAQNGFNVLGNMFGNPAMQLALQPTAGQIDLVNKQAAALAAMQANRYDDSKLINEVAGLRNDVNTLNDKMGNLQVVMDSGPLVGAIAPKMDTELGTIYRRRNRG